MIYFFISNFSHKTCIFSFPYVLGMAMLMLISWFLNLLRNFEEITYKISFVHQNQFPSSSFIFQMVFSFFIIIATFENIYCFFFSIFSLCVLIRPNISHVHLTVVLSLLEASFLQPQWLFSALCIKWDWQFSNWHLRLGFHIFYWVEFSSNPWGIVWEGEFP